MTNFKHYPRPWGSGRLLLLLGSLLLGVLSTGCHPIDLGEYCEDGNCVAVCKYNGQGYLAGESFPSSDGCNSCSCQVDGSVACTERACVSACGGLLGLRCAEGEFCNYQPGDLCGAADATGVCEPIPEACDTQYDPVCGCDDTTYSNACFAAMAGVGISASGECLPTAGDPGGDDGSGDRDCGGIAGLACEEGEFCSFAPEARCGAADQLGTCATKPEACIQLYDPVCGCDGNTYGNACTAASAGVSIQAQGECEDVGTSACGGLLGLSCEEGQFCDYEPSDLCGRADAPGACRDIPEVCTEEYSPVCGCDGNTYGNDCFAAMAGVGIDFLGECLPVGGNEGDCGGLLGLSCADDEFCSYAPEAQCGAADQLGTCSRKPEACIQLYDPVCGCDGNTYGNACTAASFGVSVASTGECLPDFGGGNCGGIAGLACGAGEFCNYAPEAQCGAADQLGTCTPIPDACTKEYAPVCGCDGNTYGNDCTAAAAGVSIVSQGECQAEGQFCGTRGAPLTCAPEEFCSYDPGANCGRADAPGSCELRPEICTQEVNPVCGCDGNTYGNACSANSMGVSVDYMGPCLDSCDYDGVTYQPGDSFPSSDGCNTCSCTDNGMVVCTLRACVEL